MLYGLVLAGGESRRMGTPKSLISYHGMPQYRHAATLLGAYCSKI
ncbi:MAG: NTP transferase domain-containing protein, partial [Saprospiraceae bacterium]|nr:NTP transferase domain-containing protein [Saprospiraceae bacterium]